MADVEVQNGKARAEAEEEELIAMESRAEEEEDLPSKADASYVFVSGGGAAADHDPDPDPSTGPDGNVNDDAPPPGEEENPQPHANGVHHHETADSLVGDDASTETTDLSHGVQDGTLEVAALQSPPDSPSVHIVDVEGKSEAEPLPSIEFSDSQIPVVKDAHQPDPDHLLLIREGEQQLPPLQDAVDPQTEPGLESSHDPDMPPPLLERDLKLDTADDTQSPASDASALVSDLHAGLGSHPVDSNCGGTSEQTLSLEVESSTSSDSKTVQGCPIAHENETPEHSAYETSVADGNMVQVVDVEIDSVQESVQLPGISQEALPDLPQATPSESQLPFVVETPLPSAANHEGAYVPSQENGSPVRALEHGSLDEDPVLAEEVEETTIRMDAEDSSSNDSHLPEDKEEVQKEPVHADVVECGPANGMIFGTIPVTFGSKDVSRGDVGECDSRFNVDNPDGHTIADDSTNGHSGETNSSKEVEGDYIVQNSLTAPTEDIQSQDVHVSESEVLDKSMNSSENTLADPDIQSGGDQNARVDILNETCEENGTNGLCVEETPASSLEGSPSDANDCQNAPSDVARKLFYYMVKVPYFEDQSLRDQIADAELQVAEKTKIRDAIQGQRQVPREKQRENANIIKAAKAARGSLSAKRREMDSLNLVIDKTKVASQVVDIDAQIRNMEHSMQHETLSLKEEKQRIREIKQLKEEREQLSNKMASQVEVQQAFDQKDQAEERLKLLKKEADILRENFIKADAEAKVAQKKFDEEQKKLDELDDHYRSANATRQEAYAHLQSLKKRFYDKRRFFSQFKGESERAKTLALNKDWQGLEHHCDNQLHRVMELWNNDVEFRKDYMRCNLRNTIWRLGTLDGRSLGPGEEPPLIPTSSDRVAKLNTVTSEPTVAEVPCVSCVDTKTGVVKSLATVGDKKNMMSKAKDAVRSLVVDTNTVSGGDAIIDQASEEDHKLTKEEEEMAKMAEELRKKEEEARLKEQRKMEEKAKAIEAMERKKRNAERAQARAALKAQKEAEQKEKEREKKARKKEKKKAATEDPNPMVVGNSSSCSTEAASSETKESEGSENPVAVSKRPQKGKQFTKQSKPKSSIPPPLRNRGRRRMQTWMWVVVAVVALFVVGNISFFSLSSWLDGVGH